MVQINMISVSVLSSINFSVSFSFTFEDACVDVATLLEMPGSNELTEQEDWRENQPSQVTCVSEDLKR